MKMNVCFGAAVAVLCLGLMSGCGTAPTQTAEPVSKVDPLENMNRSVFEFNNSFDKAVFKPVAQGYADTLPSFMQTAVGNFFGNFNDLWTGINSFLQGNVQDGFTDLMRVGLNSTFGFLGLLDIASEANIPKHRNDFGETLGVWGVPDGPYLVLPFLGPSVTRDTVALPVDFYGDAFSYVRPVWQRNTGELLRMVDKRAGYLDSFNLMQDAALDEYSFVRDAYLQRIKSQIETRKNYKQLRDEDAETQKQNDDDEAKAKAKAESNPASTPTP